MVMRIFPTGLRLQHLPERDADGEHDDVADKLNYLTRYR